MNTELKIDSELLQGSPERFGYEWKNYSQILPESRDQLQRWLGKFSLENFKGKTVLDGGCGMGRNPYWMLQSGAAHVTAIDVDDGSLNSARKNLSSFANAKVEKISVYELSSSSLGKFDVVTSIGVVHHLASPLKAIENLWSCVQDGGCLVLWVYGKQGNELFLPIIQCLRAVGSRLPLPIAHLLAKFVAILAWPLLRFFPWTNSYYKSLRTLSFKNVESIIFDQIIPKIANYWTREDLEFLLKTIEGKISIELVQGNSWSVHIYKGKKL